MKVNDKRVKTYSLDQIKNELIGPRGTKGRDEYEFELELERVGEMIRLARLRRNLTQTQLGVLVGVQKSQISKLEKRPSNMSVETLLRLFSALKARVSFNVQLSR